MTNKPKLVIIGAGFGGVFLAKALKKVEVEVLLVDQNNYHNFQPLMYQIATGGLEPDSIAYPIRRIFRRQKNMTFRMGNVKGINSKNKQLETSIGKIDYDYLVIATGSKTNYFNFEPVKNQLLTLKSIPEALNLRSFIFQNLERSLLHSNIKSIDKILNIAVVGGGPSGLELAGALAEMKRYVIPKDFPDLDTSKMNINLYEVAPKLLSSMSDIASSKALEYLKDLGVNVFLNAKVESYKNNTLILEDATEYKTDTVIWTAGVKGNLLSGLPESSVAGHRIKVDQFNRVLETDSIFAIGDVSACITSKNPKGLPMLAPVAQQQGEHFAKNLKKLLRGEDMQPFEYKDKGTMATIGRKKAVVDLPHYKFQGTFAWIIWMLVHIFSLIGFRNKFVAFYDWTSNYFSYDKPLGLIIRPFSKKQT